jgi:hypothetical protein
MLEIESVQLFLRDPTDETPPPSLRMETDPVSEMLCFLVFRILDNGQSSKPSDSKAQNTTMFLHTPHKFTMIPQRV